MDGQDGDNGSVTVQVFTNNVLTNTREFISSQTYSPLQSFSVTYQEFQRVTIKDYTLDAGNDDPTGMVADDQKVYVWDDTDDQLVEYPGATQLTLARTGMTLIEWESLVVADDKLFVLATHASARKWVAWDFPARTRSATDDVTAGAGLSSADGATFRDSRLWQLLDDTLYAYSLSDSQSIERFSIGDFDLHVDNDDVHGMTIDGDDLFTVDDTGLNILGYNSSGNRNSLLDRALDNDNSDPGAIVNDDTYFYVTDAVDDQVYRYVRTQTTIANPGIRRMVVWDDRLWGISIDGQLYYTFAFADGWTEDAKIPAFSVPVTDLFVYRNGAGEPVLFVMTEEGLWLHDVANQRFEQSEIPVPQVRTERPRFHRLARGSVSPGRPLSVPLLRRRQRCPFPGRPGP